MEGPAHISPDVLARYAADAACAVAGVSGLAEGRLRRRRGVRVALGDDGLALELRLRVEAGTALPSVGRAVQEQVADYLDRMADTRPTRVDVVVDEIGER